ncbi:Single-stranded nucleic acid binding R3H [Cordyceps fumosorosea ARSEF 2679]|uniref:Single-stranded nucleic acid binding R3H n=1 Tax=Cordyceps fumosorosea (strain ARSEF 2679) TaxID=1081104 RepID=A0A167TLI0_CORFA|nr:Single-stranded nucleic acid binding R3H [Cordyceps fumosorosea ARSEF 2679]OAA60722.1 Single-stranded nucleic acid binding R3H [Cordyceps fumosorosea ARSEF 2679]
MEPSERPPATDPVVVVGACHLPKSVVMPLKRPGVAPNIDTAAASLSKLNLDSAASNAAAADKLSTIQRLDSGSDSGTKPSSLDGKSIISGTTFALDEKESLRPDDSASVQAAAEDDDAASLLAGSRLGSEAAAIARARPAIAMGSNTTGILTPQSTSSEPPAENGDAGTSDALHVIYRKAPDEKLIFALNSARDRLFLLLLEKDVIDFVQNSKEPYMDIPPSNSFCRMLTHKLADYYHMTHSYEHHIGSVRIFRTPFCRVPESLASMVPQPAASTGSTPPPAVLPRKIMRRGQDGDSAAASASPSKPASEAGSDAKDKQPANQKLSREQREENYKITRLRIFGPEDKDKENTAENDADTGMSRTSSASANRSNLGKRGKQAKQRRDSDGFDSRNQYHAYWGPQQQTWVPQSQAQYGPPGVQYNAGPSNYQAPPSYVQQGPMYGPVPAMPPNPGYPTYPAGQYHSSGSPVVYAQQPQMVTNTPPLGWQQPYTASGPYPPQGPPPPGPPQAPNQSPVPNPGPGGIPYAFGQLPANANPHDPKSQHPIPGSYNRNHSFNPKTQSFNPGAPLGPAQMGPVHPPQPPFTAPGSHHSSPQISAPPHLAYAGYQSPMPPPYGGAYGMVRQGSNNSIPSYHGPPHGTPPHVAMQTPQHMPQPPPMVVNGRPPPHGPAPNGQMYSHLPTYGNPATLPQKPATGM